MKIFDPKRHLPAGFDWEPTRDGLIWGHILSGLTLFNRNSVFLCKGTEAFKILFEILKRNGLDYHQLFETSPHVFLGRHPTTGHR